MECRGRIMHEEPLKWLLCFLFGVFPITGKVTTTSNSTERHNLGSVFLSVALCGVTVLFKTKLFSCWPLCLRPTRLLGCFSDTKKLGPTGVFPSNAQPFQRLLEDEAAPGGCAGDSVCPTLKHCSKLFIYLYKMATDSFDRSVGYRKGYINLPLTCFTLCV